MKKIFSYLKFFTHFNWTSPFFSIKKQLGFPNEAVLPVIIIYCSFFSAVKTKRCHNLVHFSLPFIPSSSPFYLLNVSRFMLISIISSSVSRLMNRHAWSSDHICLYPIELFFSFHQFKFKFSCFSLSPSLSLSLSRSRVASSIVELSCDLAWQFLVQKTITLFLPN